MNSFDRVTSRLSVSAPTIKFIMLPSYFAAKSVAKLTSPVVIAKSEASMFCGIIFAIKISEGRVTNIP